MKKRHEAEMPEDWNHRRAWDAYYESRLSRPRQRRWDGDTGSVGIKDLPQFAAELKSRGWRDIWIPGCGLSPLARLLARLGFQTVATDVSPIAVAFQRDGASDLDRLRAKLGPAESDGSFIAEVHDFRADFRHEALDLIINVKAFQAFPVPDMRRIARTHAAALREGRFAYFDTMNVQGDRRDHLEQALEDGGFVVPFSMLNRWYRQALNDTGIPYLFILGRPMIARTGEHADDSSRWEQDMARLRLISSEYERRLQAEREAEESRFGPDARIAQVIYSTD